MVCFLSGMGAIMGIVIVLFCFIVVISLIYIFWYLKYGMPGDIPPVLLYHKVTNNFQFEGTWVYKKQFNKQMEWLYDSGYETILPLSLKDIKGQQKKLLITFDDGFADVYNNALPIMEKYGFKGTVFIISGYINKNAYWDLPGKKHYPLLSKHQIKELYSMGWNIGVHSFSHRDLTKVKGEDLKKEIFTAKEILEDLLGENVYLFSYPYGRYNEKVYNMVKEAGYKMAFSSCPSLKNNKIDMFAIYRRSIYITDSMFAFKEKIQPTSWIRYGFEDIAIRSINAVSQLTPIIQRRRYK